MGIKDKADVVQGMAGAAWILLIVAPFFGLLSIPNQYLWAYSLGWLALGMLGAYIVYLKESGGIDVFGMVSSVWGVFTFLYVMLVYLAMQAPGLIPILQWMELIFGGGIIILPRLSLATVIQLIIGIGLLLEAFDVIKPVK